MAKYPNITVKLVGTSSHPIAIVETVRKALRANGVSVEERDQFRTEALSGDYNHVIATASEWVKVT